jgi:transcriptional regulator with XRE-family HTH domain
MRVTARDRSATSKREVIRSRLCAARRRAGLSQGEAARLLNMHRPTISEIEAGNRNVSAEELARFAELYDVGIEWIFGVDADDGSADGLSKNGQQEAIVWTESRNARRCELIDRKVQDVITAEENDELERLQCALRQYIDRVAPLPMEGAKRLHAQLLRKRRGR